MEKEKNENNVSKEWLKTDLEKIEEIMAKEDIESRKSARKAKDNIKKDDFINFVRDLLIILSIALFIRFFIISPFQISGLSMSTSFSDKEYILVDLLSYRFDNPKRWDVVVFIPENKNNVKKFFIKRIIWLPEETIKFEWWEVYIKQKSREEFVKIDEPYLSPKNKWKTEIPIFMLWKKEFDIPAWSYFVMWDNRTNSSDSRSCFTYTCTWDWLSHFIKKSDITSRWWKVLVSLWYFSIFETTPNLRFWSFSWEVEPRFFNMPNARNYTENK